MSFIPSRDWYTEVSKGNIPGHSIVHKFGEYDSVGTAFVPVTNGGIWRTPQVASATTLRIKAGNANDIAGGTGAQEVTLEYINTSGVLVTEALATAGTSASAVTAQTAIRLNRAYVSKSGTYATVTPLVASHVGDIVIENGSGGTDWGTIRTAGVAHGQTQIGCYTVPTGKNAYILSAEAFSDSSKVTQFLFFKRESILGAATPYDPFRVIFELRGDGGEVVRRPEAPINSITGPCDIGFLAKVNTGTAEVEVDFELLLVDV